MAELERESVSVASCEQRWTSCVCLHGLIFASKTYLLPTGVCVSGGVAKTVSRFSL